VLVILLGLLLLPTNKRNKLPPNKTSHRLPNKTSPLPPRKSCLSPNKCWHTYSKRVKKHLHIRFYSYFNYVLKILLLFQAERPVQTIVFFGGAGYLLANYTVVIIILLLFSLVILMYQRLSKKGKFSHILFLSKLSL